MYLKLDHPPVSLDDYLAYMDPAQAEELVSLADELRGLRMAHLNSTATGGGVAEILQSMVPLFNALGHPHRANRHQPYRPPILPCDKEDSQSSAGSRRLADRARA